jgi:hypothetical protein
MTGAQARDLAARLEAHAPALGLVKPPHPLTPADSLFLDGEPRTDLTLLQMVGAMFECPNNGESSNPAVTFLGNVLLANADDMYLVNSLNDVLDHGDVVDRVLLRATWRAAFAVEIVRQVEKGEVLR